MVDVNKLITIKCDWCGKEKTIYKSCAHGKTFQACSDECKHHLTSVYLKLKWAEMTPEERDERIRKVIGDGTRHYGKGLIEYHRSLRPERVAKVIEILTEPPRPVTPLERYANKGKGTRNPRIEHRTMPMGVCTLIAAHHEMMKDDPERLTTEFMQSIIKVDCKCQSKEKGEENGGKERGQVG